MLEYIQSIKSLHPADQADSIENSILKIKPHFKNIYQISSSDFIAHLREETRDEILNLIPKNN